MATLQGQVCIVTGGGSGVGKATAAGLLALGANVVIAGRDANKLADAIQEFNAPERCVAIATDIGNAQQCERLVQTTLDRFSTVDVLVNNAGTNLKARTMRELTAESWDEMIQANLNGAFYCTKAVLPTMLARTSGLIINVVSVAGKRANPLGGAAYVAAKFGMGALGLVLSNEEKDAGIRVSNIYPGEIDTPILSARPTPVSDSHRASILKAEDVAAAILYVAQLPPRVCVPELVIKPTTQMYW